MSSPFLGDGYCGPNTPRFAIAPTVLPAHFLCSGRGDAVLRPLSQVHPQSEPDLGGPRAMQVVHQQDAGDQVVDYVVPQPTFHLHRNQRRAVRVAADGAVAAGLAGRRAEPRGGQAPGVGGRGQPPGRAGKVGPEVVAWHVAIIPGGCDIYPVSPSCHFSAATGTLTERTTTAPTSFAARNRRLTWPASAAAASARKRNRRTPSPTAWSRRVISGRGLAHTQGCSVDSGSDTSNRQPATTRTCGSIPFGDMGAA